MSGMISEVTESPMVEICPVWGGYIFACAIPIDSDDDDEGSVFEYRVCTSADIDVMLEQIKRYLVSTQHRWRKGGAEDADKLLTIPKPAPKSKSRPRKAGTDDGEDG